MNTRHFNPIRTVFAAAALMLAMAAHAASAPSLSTGSAAPQNLGVPAPAADVHDIRDPKPITSPWLIPLVAVTALLATAAAFTIQSWAQQHLPASHTALIFTLEPVFAWLTSLIFLGEKMGRRALLGAGLILVGILLAELRPTSRSQSQLLPIAGA